MKLAAKPKPKFRGTFVARKRFSQVQRDQHRGAANDLIAHLERRLNLVSPSKPRGAYEQNLAERVDFYKARLNQNLGDQDLMRLNLELAELFYRCNNADKRKRSPAH